jgi:membrane associated rhomboid family serine protease
MFSSIATVFIQIFYSPITSLLITLLVWVWVQLFTSRSDGKAYAVGYYDCMVRQQWWRVFTAPLCHTSIFHLLLSIVTLWGCRHLEQKLGSWFYFRYSILLAISESLLGIGIIHGTLKLNNINRLQISASHPLAGANSIGLSGILLSWLAYESVSLTFQADYPFYFLGVIPLPWIFAPMVFIFAAQLFAHRTQGLTNAMGLISGYLLALGLLQILPDIYWSVCFLVDVVLFIILKSAEVQPDGSAVNGATPDSDNMEGELEGRILSVPILYPGAGAGVEGASTSDDIETGNGGAGGGGAAYGTSTGGAISSGGGGGGGISPSESTTNTTAGAVSSSMLRSLTAPFGLTRRSHSSQSQSQLLAEENVPLLSSQNSIRGSAGGSVGRGGGDDTDSDDEGEEGAFEGVSNDVRSRMSGSPDRGSVSSRGDRDRDWDRDRDTSRKGNTPRG